MWHLFFRPHTSEHLHRSQIPFISGSYAFHIWLIYFSFSSVSWKVVSCVRMNTSCKLGRVLLQWLTGNKWTSTSCIDPHTHTHRQCVCLAQRVTDWQNQITENEKEQEVTHHSFQCVAWRLPVQAGRDMVLHTSLRCSFPKHTPGTPAYTAARQKWIMGNVLQFALSLVSAAHSTCAEVKTMCDVVQLQNSLAFITNIQYRECRI